MSEPAPAVSGETARNAGPKTLASEVLLREQNSHLGISLFLSGKLWRVMALDGIIQTPSATSSSTTRCWHTFRCSPRRKPGCADYGGGDGGLLREVLKARGVDHDYPVEIDQAVIRDVCIEVPAEPLGAVLQQSPRPIS